MSQDNPEDLSALRAEVEVQGPPHGFLTYRKAQVDELK